MLDQRSTLRPEALIILYYTLVESRKSYHRELIMTEDSIIIGVDILNAKS